MGFGHRVYRVRDPRADVLGRAAEALFSSGDSQLYKDARTVERVVLRVLEAHKPGRRLQTNVEFYTALVLHGVGLASELFSSVFALSRIGSAIISLHPKTGAANDFVAYGSACSNFW